MRDYNEMRMKVLECIEMHPSMTIEEMCESLYLSRTSLTRYLRIFKEEELICDNGKKRADYQRLLTNKGRLLL
ncbi:MAG: winged helix-turn-helix transcriptional regulator, partial [Anaeroplasmataceae bacterium]|nr:winged helix-turn-helix transcriptional regulator [Anaeroplasmataceae bacterium]